jgi:hypothetical protein
MIYSTHTQDSFIDSFKNEAGNLEDFSYDGLTALFDYFTTTKQKLDYLEQDNYGDSINIACYYFAEYPTATAVVNDYGWTGCTFEQEAQALEWLEQQTTVITFNNGLIIQRF